MNTEPQPKPRIVDKETCIIELFSTSWKPSEWAPLKIDSIYQQYQWWVFHLQDFMKRKIHRIELNGGVHVFKEPILVTKDTVIQVQYITRTGTLEVLDLSTYKKAKNT